MTQESYQSNFIVVLFYYRVTGADNGIASLFSGFLTEMLTVVIAATSFATYKVLIIMLCLFVSLV